MLPNFAQLSVNDADSSRDPNWNASPELTDLVLGRSSDLRTHIQEILFARPNTVEGINDLCVSVERWCKLHVGMCNEDEWRVACCALGVDRDPNRFPIKMTWLEPGQVTLELNSYKAWFRYICDVIAQVHAEIGPTRAAPPYDTDALYRVVKSFGFSAIVDWALKKSTLDADLAQRFDGKSDALREWRTDQRRFATPLLEWSWHLVKDHPTRDMSRDDVYETFTRAVLRFSDLKNIGLTAKDQLKRYECVLEWALSKLATKDFINDEMRIHSRQLSGMCARENRVEPLRAIMRQHHLNRVEMNFHDETMFVMGQHRNIIMVPFREYAKRTPGYEQVSALVEAYYAVQTGRIVADTRMRSFLEATEPIGRDEKQGLARVALVNWHEMYVEWCELIEVPLINGLRADQPPTLPTNFEELALLQDRYE